MTLAGALAGLIVLTSDFEEYSLIERLFAIAFTMGFICAGTWLAWPIFLACSDLFAHAGKASELILTRTTASSNATHHEFLTLATVVEGGAVAFAAAAPGLCWLMRREKPDSVRPWLLLAAIPIGYVVLLHHGFHVPPFGALGDRIVLSCQQMLKRHEAALTLGLYAENLWLGGLVGTHWTGMPVGGWTLFLAPIALVPFWVGFYLERPFWQSALLILGGIALGPVVLAIKEAEDQSEIARRATRAANQWKHFLSGGTRHGPPFALYLRSFNTTGTLDAQPASEEFDPLDLESILSAALLPGSRLLGLNREQAKAVVGADYLYGADQDWWNRFQNLANTSKLIFLVPSARGGTFTEIAWLKNQHLLSKCVFIMPETISATGFHAGSKVWVALKYVEEQSFDHTLEWHAARQAILEQTKLVLPDYQTDGALFTLDEAGNVKSMARLRLARTLFKVAKLRRALRAVLAVNGPAQA